MKDLVKTYSTFIIYSYLPILLVVGNLFFGHTYSSDSLNDVLWLNIACDILFVLILVPLSIDVFKKHAKFEGTTRKSKIKNFILLAIVSFFILLGFKMASAMIVTVIAQIFKLSTEAQNQSVLEDLFKMAPVINVFCGVALAPITEELVFRGAIGRIIKNKKVFLIVSGLTFGLVHVLSTSIPIFVVLILGCLIDIILTSKIKKNKKIWLSILASIVMLLVLVLSLHMLSGNIFTLITSIDISEAVNSLVYISMGLGFAFIYVKYDNIYLNICGHMLNNALGYIALLTLL